MIIVDSVSKYFGKVKAVDNISFNISENRIVGLLGPNGAGKTTIMRLLSGFLIPDTGMIEISGMNLNMPSANIKKSIGYLPENCPLYYDMRVDEYLKYRALLKGVLPRRVPKQIRKVKELCGINNSGNKIIDTLSKGFCQRVGLADVLIHDPEILILDEPTTGLDPIQIKEVRGLINNLSENHTVILSSHIMQEVEAICDDVILVNKGTLVISESKNKLFLESSINKLVCIEAKVDIAIAKNYFTDIGNIEIKNINKIDEEWVKITLSLNDKIKPEDLYKIINSTNWILRLFDVNNSSLEQIFLKLINKQENT